LLAYIGNATGAQLLIGASAMTYNPHFHHFVSPIVVDQTLGASDQWQLTPALLLLDSFPPSSRPARLTQAAGHAPGVWILWSSKDRALIPDLAEQPELQRVQAVMHVELSSSHRIVHKDNCWEEAHWDTHPMPFKAQLWFVSEQLALQRRADSCAANLRQDLHRWEHPEYDFHWHDDPVPRALDFHHKH
jgi:hypothetical protein